jgi:hypothetical protein
LTDTSGRAWRSLSLAEGDRREPLRKPRREADCARVSLATIIPFDSKPDSNMRQAFKMSVEAMWCVSGILEHLYALAELRRLCFSHLLRSCRHSDRLSPLFGRVQASHRSHWVSALVASRRWFKQEATRPLLLVISPDPEQERRLGRVVRATLTDSCVLTVRTTTLTRVREQGLLGPICDQILPQSEGTNPMPRRIFYF